MLDRRKKERPLMRAFEKVQALSSRIPPVRAVAVSGNLYKPHACLPGHHRPDPAFAPVGWVGGERGQKEPPRASFDVVAEAVLRRILFAAAGRVNRLREYE